MIWYDIAFIPTLTLGEARNRSTSQPIILDFRYTFTNYKVWMPTTRKTSSYGPHRYRDVGEQLPVVHHTSCPKCFQWFRWKTNSSGEDLGFPRRVCFRSELLIVEMDDPNASCKALYKKETTLEHSRILGHTQYPFMSIQYKLQRDKKIMHHTK